MDANIIKMDMSKKGKELIHFWSVCVGPGSYDFI